MSDAAWTVPQLKELFDRLIAEHDRRYEERFRAQELAVRAAFASAEVAGSKLEAGQRHTNEAQNEWRKTVQDFKDGTVSRETFNSAIKNLEDKIARGAADTRVIENRLAIGTGGSEALSERRKQTNWLIGVIIAVIFQFAALISAVVFFLANR